MQKPVSAAEANREFSRILQDVKKGNTFLVTSHGKPVARIAPVRDTHHFAESALAILLDRLGSEPAIDIGPWTRDELYDR